MELAAVDELRGRPVSVAAVEDEAVTYPFVLAGNVVGDLVVIPDSGAARDSATAVPAGARLLLAVAEPDGRLLALAVVRQYRPDVHELGVTDPGVFRRINRRSAFRVEMRYPLRIAVVVDGAGAAGDGETIDLSGTGLAARVSVEVALDAPVTVALALPDGPLLAVGVVVGRIDNRVRVRFSQVDPTGSARLATHLRRAELLAAGMGESA